MLSAVAPRPKSSCPADSRIGLPSAMTSAASSGGKPLEQFGYALAMAAHLMDQGDEVRLCSDCAVGQSRNDSAAACSRRMWRSIWRSSASIGTRGCEADAGISSTKNRARRERPERLGSGGLASGSSSLVAAPNAIARHRHTQQAHAERHQEHFHLAPLCASAWSSSGATPARRSISKRAIARICAAAICQGVRSPRLPGCQGSGRVWQAQLPRNATRELTAARRICHDSARLLPTMRIRPRLTGMTVGLAVGHHRRRGARLRRRRLPVFAPPFPGAARHRARDRARRRRVDPRGARAPDDRERPQPDRADDRELRPAAGRRAASCCSTAAASSATRAAPLGRRTSSTSARPRARRATASRPRSAGRAA